MFESNWMKLITLETFSTAKWSSPRLLSLSLSLSSVAIQTKFRVRRTSFLHFKNRAVIFLFANGERAKHSRTTRFVLKSPNYINELFPSFSRCRDSGIKISARRERCFRISCVILSRHFSFFFFSASPVVFSSWSAARTRPLLLL